MGVGTDMSAGQGAAQAIEGAQLRGARSLSTSYRIECVLSSESAADLSIGGVFYDGHRLSAAIAPDDHRLRLALFLERGDVAQTVACQDGLPPGLHSQRVLLVNGREQPLSPVNGKPGKLFYLFLPLGPADRSVRLDRRDRIDDWVCRSNYRYVGVDNDTASRRRAISYTVALRYCLTEIVLVLERCLPVG